MNEVVREWIDKADGDYLTAKREASADPPNYDAACFHAQRCIEKLLKALLIDNEQTAPKTHDLPTLAGLLSPVQARWAWPIEELRLLTRAAVTFRYPGECADSEEASATLEICKRARHRLLELLEKE